MFIQTIPDSDYRSILQVLSIFVGINSLGIFGIMFKAGRYTKQVDINTDRIGKLEQSGSPAVQRVEVELRNIHESLHRLEEMILQHIEKE